MRAAHTSGLRGAESILVESGPGKKSSLLPGDSLEPMQTTTAAVLLFCALSSCVASGDPVRGPAETEAVLARIDGEQVASAGYRRWLADVYGNPSRDEYIGLWLLEREARRLEIEVSA